MIAGQEVRITSDCLGVLDPEAEGRPVFHPDVTLNRGDLASYVGPTPEPKGWHLVSVERDGTKYVAPVHERMIEPA